MKAPIDQLISEFRGVTGIDWSPPSDLFEAAEKAIQGCGYYLGEHRTDRRGILLSLINSKFRLNKDRLQSFLDGAAAVKVFLNYHQKAELLGFLDSNDEGGFQNWLNESGFSAKLRALFRSVSPDETLAALSEQLKNGVVSRRDARQCDVAERRQLILRSLFGGYVFRSFPLTTMHSYFNPDCQTEYLPEFYQHLKRFHPRVLNRECSLIYAVLDEKVLDPNESENIRDNIYSFIRESYVRLSNHCYIALLIKPFRESGEDGQWRLFSDIVLYAEKHREVNLKTGYFHPKKIEQNTTQHIKGCDIQKAEFETANEGFFYRDCIVLSHNAEGGKVKTTSDPVTLLLLFQKNERDETLIPCPACRSMNIAGNSYPALGIRSWECQNPICPERSAFDRGNRYSLESLIKQEAIKSEEDQIPEWSLKKWKLDVVAGADDTSVTDMLLRHFTLHGDTVLFVNTPKTEQQALGRKITYESLTQDSGARAIYRHFNQSSYFHRFLVEKIRSEDSTVENVSTGIPGVEVYQGDCYEVLSRFEAGSFDGAATSPPYYNARSYAGWPNIYCYLYDMYNVARQVYRVLKPGAGFLFNIFDYFDNENNVALSSMGKKRMILGAYIINIFRRVGFKLDGNVVWFKGEIEGKRNYNQGNRSPYYQLPLNAWEHVFVFIKPGTDGSKYAFPRVLAAKPVFKIQGGINVLGHTAPYPPAIPNLLLSQMNEGERVLDPFSGSMTTGRTAHAQGIKSVSIDIHLEYCELGVNLLKADNSLAASPSATH